jgi:hypothetical protein
MRRRYWITVVMTLGTLAAVILDRGAAGFAMSPAAAVPLRRPFGQNGTAVELAQVLRPSDNCARVCAFKRNVCWPRTGTKHVVRVKARRCAVAYDRCLQGCHPRR